MCLQTCHRFAAIPPVPAVKRGKRLDRPRPRCAPRKHANCAEYRSALMCVLAWPVQQAVATVDRRRGGRIFPLGGLGAGVLQRAAAQVCERVADARARAWRRLQYACARPRRRLREVSRSRRRVPGGSGSPAGFTGRVPMPRQCSGSVGSSCTGDLPKSFLNCALSARFVRVVAVV